jgi:hypothetical protein
VTFAPGRFGVGEGVEHQLAPGERRIDREVCVPAAETDACGCRTMSGAQPAVAQLGESIGDGCDRTEDASDTVAAVRSGPVEGSSPSESCAARANLGRSDLSSNDWPRSVSTTLAVLSISSLTLPTASAGSSLIARLMRSKPSRMADGSASLAMDSIDSCGPTGVIWPVCSSTW